MSDAMFDRIAAGRPEAASAMARVIDRASEQVERTSKLRRGGVLRGLVALSAGGVLFYFGRWIGGGVAATLGSLTLSLAVLSPTVGYVALTRAVDRLGEGIGAFLSWALLTPVFWLFFVPFGLLARRGSRDRMGRRFDRGAKTYWITRPPKTDADQRRDLERPY